MKRQSDRNRLEQAGVNWRCSGVVSDPVPPLACVRSNQRDSKRFKTHILSTRSLSNKTCVLINTTCCFTWVQLLYVFHSTALRFFKSNWDSCGCFFAFDSSQAASGSRVDNGSLSLTYNLGWLACAFQPHWLKSIVTAEIVLHGIYVKTI